MSGAYVDWERSKARCAPSTHGEATSPSRCPERHIVRIRQRSSGWADLTNTSGPPGGDPGAVVGVREEPAKGD